MITTVAGAAAIARIQPQIACAATDDQADVGIPVTVAPHALHHRRLHLGLAHGELQQDRLRPPIETREVLLEAKHPPPVGANALKHTVPVQEAAIEHRDAGLGLGHELTV